MFDVLINKLKVYNSSLLAEGLLTFIPADDQNYQSFTTLGFAQAVHRCLHLLPESGKSNVAY